MFNIFKKIKNKIMKKEELEQQIADAIAVAQRLGEENKRLKTENDTLIASNTQLKEDFESAVERVRYLAEQIKMVDAQKKASTQFNDRERNY
jgi:regulator of replication initiation timing